MKSTSVLSSPGRTLAGDPGRQAFLLLRTVFTVAPIIFGLDKFTNLLADWTIYLAPVATSVVPLPAQTIMYIVGVVEVIAGIAVAVRTYLRCMPTATRFVARQAPMCFIPAMVAMADASKSSPASMKFCRAWAHSPFAHDLMEPLRVWTICGVFWMT